MVLASEKSKGLGLSHCKGEGGSSPSGAFEFFDKQANLRQICHV